jgi:hypothetical protein
MGRAALEEKCREMEALVQRTRWVGVFFSFLGAYVDDIKRCC